MSASAIAQARLQRQEQRTSPARPTETAEQPERVCRYCGEPEKPGTAEGELIVPCHCQGNLRFVHLALPGLALAVTAPLGGVEKTVPMVRARARDEDLHVNHLRRTCDDDY